MTPSKTKVSLYFVKLLNWEYWPFEVVYFPVFLYYLWLAARARSFFYFSASNPSILTGGMAGESKGKILEQIPDQYKAKTIFIPKGMTFNGIVDLISLNAISYPLIAKPDVGERGKMVEKINSELELRNYHANHYMDFLIQEYISYPLELGIFYYRFPEEEIGIVTSITEKVFLQVKGNGHSTIAELMENQARARFQIERLKSGLDITYIPQNEEIVILEPIGNHCRGTTFLNANHYIDKELQQSINKISKSIPDFYFGRYDLRCSSIEELKKGFGIKIMELNGAGAEPSHIYHPGASILEAYKVLFAHWNIMYQISIANHRKGVPYLSFQEGKRIMFGQ